MQGQRETNASNTSLIDDIYDDIMLNEEKRKKTFNIKDYSIKVVEEIEEEEQPKEHGIFKNIFSKQENKYKSNGSVLEVDGKKVYTKSEQEKEKQRRSDRYYYTKERQKARRHKIKPQNTYGMFYDTCCNSTYNLFRNNIGK